VIIEPTADLRGGKLARAAYVSGALLLLWVAGIGITLTVSARRRVSAA
jgi:hypothetical protein